MIMYVNKVIATLLTIQYNLTAGTLCQYMSDRPDLQAVVQDILDWRVQ